MYCLGFFIVVYTLVVLPVVVVAASLCELHSIIYTRTQACRVDDPACNIPMRYTDARDAYVCAMSCCRNCVMYVRQLSLLQLLIIWTSDRHFHSF